jgi:hypothetical protein
MTDQAVALLLQAIPPEVQAFAAEKGVSRYRPAMVSLARRAFPSSAPVVSLGEDAEDQTHRYIALDVEVGGLETKELLAGQRTWSAGVPQDCPSRHAVSFVLGWR